MSKIEIIQGDCVEVLPSLPRVRMIFADPPDNMGVTYDGYKDKLSDYDYRLWLGMVIDRVLYGTRPDLFWLSYSSKYMPDVLNHRHATYDARTFIWHYTFGQNRQDDCVGSYRPITRWMRADAGLYPDAIRVASARQAKYKDKRANPIGKVPDDVWNFSRVCGTFKERRKWHPNQHPEALMERIIKLSCVPGDTVIDLFSGTGTTLRVCKGLNIDCIGVEISERYCEEIRKELKCV
jgi:site-specific DNA-methyltransferase (adenine-specific)